MVTNSKLTLKPKLQFPSFREGPDWTGEKVANLVDAVTPPKKLQTSAYSIQGAFPIVDQSQTDICGWTDDRDALISENLPLIVFGDHTCILKLVDRPFAQGADGIKILQARSRIDAGFLYQSLQNRPVRTEEYKRHFSILKERFVFFPNIETGEQQKIADFLSTLDELIGTESQKINALKTHKKGLMQKIFPREGETIPHLRFPEFQDGPEWEDRKLEDLAKRGSGHTPNKAHPEYYNGGIKWVSLADSKRLDKRLISETRNEISKKGIENSSAVLHPAGTVLVSRDAGVGKSAVMGSPMAVSQHFIVWTCDSSKLVNWFLYYLLQTMKPLFERSATGSTIKTIGLQFFIDLNVMVPSTAEQHRIVECLSSLDDLIAAQSDGLEVLEKYKQWIMQKLFPSLAEVEA